MKKIILLIFILLITSCQKQDVILYETASKEDTLNNQIKVFTVIPHHNLVNNEIDEFYKELQKKYNNFDNIVLIGPNHFTSDGNTSLLEDKKICYKSTKLECIKSKNLNFIENGKLISSFKEKGDYIEIDEHAFGNHFQFLNKYFNNFNVYGILLKINTEKTAELDDIKDKLDGYNFEGDTLFIASVDFSHHVNEKVAVFHDLKTLNYLNGNFDSKLEVDCPNCLYLIKDLAKENNNPYFTLSNRTSVDTKLNINSNFDNTTHIYGEFTKNLNLSFEKSFSSSYKKSEFENILTGGLNKNEVFGMFFGDTHFTRGFTNNNPYEIEDYLKCFYSNKDINRKPIFWHNRLFYSLDFVGVNLETSVGNKNECQKSSKEIIFRTEPNYLDNFKDIGINLFSTSNNHSYDCGQIGSDATKKYLNEKGLNYYGDGRKTEESIFKKNINGTKIAFLGFNDIDLDFNEDVKNNKIKRLKEEGYLVIVNIHWGYEYSLKSNKRQQILARGFIDNGANLIIGHHPHVVQEYEEYKGVPIFYSLGNFIFDQPFENTLKGYGVVFSINNDGIKYNILEFDRDSKNYMIECNSFK